MFGGQHGDCTDHHHQQRIHSVRRTRRSPTSRRMALSFVTIPGFANNVDVSGNFAYVAAGAAGLQVVNVANRAARSSSDRSTRRAMPTTCG